MPERPPPGGRSRGRTVYSTRSGDQRKATPQPPPRRSLPPQQQTARIALDKRHRRGKQVTVVSDLVLSDKDITGLSKALKSLCGAGGTVKEGRIEIQGDHRDTIVSYLSEQGYKVKRVGG